MGPWSLALMRAGDHGLMVSNRVIEQVEHMNSDAKGIIIGCGNHKGGVSKSTSATYLAAALGERGLSVLVVDCDPSAGATRIFGIDGKSFAGTYEFVLRDDEPDPVKLAVSDGLPRNV